jgi:light-independent protochlorophyllide reductase subunit B
VFVFGDASHAIAAARVAAEEFGFQVVGLGSYSREFGASCAPPPRATASRR